MAHLKMVSKCVGVSLFPFYPIILKLEDYRKYTNLCYIHAWVPLEIALQEGRAGDD